MTVERTIEEYARVAYLDPALFFDSEGKLLRIAEMPEAARRAVASIEVEELFACNLRRSSKSSNA